MCVGVGGLGGGEGVREPSWRACAHNHNCHNACQAPHAWQPACAASPQSCRLSMGGGQVQPGVWEGGREAPGDLGAVHAAARAAACCASPRPLPPASGTATSPARRLTVGDVQAGQTRHAPALGNTRREAKPAGARARRVCKHLTKGAGARACTHGARIPHALSPAARTSGRIRGRRPEWRRTPPPW